MGAKPHNFRFEPREMPTAFECVCTRGGSVAGADVRTELFN